MENMAYLNPAQLVAQRNAHIIYIHKLLYVYIYMLMHILYIYYTHISTLFHQTNCYNQNGDRPWGKGGGGFFFSLGVDVCTKGYKHEVVQTANIRSQVC